MPSPSGLYFASIQGFVTFALYGVLIGQAVPTAASTPRFPQGPDLEGLNVNDPGSYVSMNKSKISFRPDPGINAKRILSHFDGA